PGADLDVAATGFEGCRVVRLLFDGTRIGTAPPDAAGTAEARGLSVPGGASTGGHLVTATCQVGAVLLRATAPFRVEHAATHRPAFVTALAEPRQVGTSAGSLLISAVGALGMLLTVAFPSELFNSTLDENYEEVRGWFGLKPAAERSPPAAGRQALAFVGFVLLGGLLYGFLSPDLGFDRSSVALVLGLSLSLVVVSVAFRLPHLIYLHHEDKEWGRFRVLPGTALVAVACVALSRLVHFQPGYLYGLIAGLSFRRRLTTDTNGALTAASAVAVFAIGLLAWVARVPVSAAAARPHASIWMVALEACLAAVTILGLETVVICLIPLRFVEGSKLAAWSRTAWAVLFALCAFAFVHILLRPDSGYVAASSSRWTVVALFVGFGILSVGFWAYFRFRPARPPASRSPQPERQPELVG
ncbi:MAG TPA: FGLLP motif-containing membrane protein, partial [Trebonia sp.]|nr:FGLLP motif-containing membrane protein [Trebonia sp.]